MVEEDIRDKRYIRKKDCKSLGGKHDWKYYYGLQSSGRICRKCYKKESEEKWDEGDDDNA